MTRTARLTAPVEVARANRARPLRASTVGVQQKCAQTLTTKSIFAGPRKLSASQLGLRWELRCT
jgi:hypothetical protein